MRTGAARGQAGHFHEAGFYGSDAEFRALIVPFAEEGIAAGEPVIIGCDDRKSGLLRSWLTDPSAVEFLGAKSLYATPAGAIATCRRLFEFHVAMGAGQIRMAGEVPHPGNGGRFEGWDRFESAVNIVWEDFPVWGRCLYDTATAAAAVLERRRANAPPHRLAAGRAPGERPLPRRPGVRRPPVRARSARSLTAPGRTGQPVRRRCPARARPDRPRPHPRRHGPRPADRRHRGRHQRAAPRPPARDRTHLGRVGPYRGHRSRHWPRSSRSPGGPRSRSRQRPGPAAWVWAVGHAPARPRRRAPAHRRRLHGQAPGRNNHWLSHAALASRDAQLEDLYRAASELTRGGHPHPARQMTPRIFRASSRPCVRATPVMPGRRPPVAQRVGRIRPGRAPGRRVHA